MNTTNADWAAAGLWPTFQSPDHLHQVVQQLGNQYEIVKPSRLLELIP